MARISHNIVIDGLLGSLGKQLILKHDRAGRTIISLKPQFDPNRVFTPAQKAQQNAFREAVAYAGSAQTNPLYIKKAAGTLRTPYNIAVSDWFHAPEILDIIIDAYTGAPGQPIRVKAIDDVKVTSVTILITDETGALIEQGPATQLDRLTWKYTTTVAAPCLQPTIQAAVQDLPGHTTTMEKVK